MTITDALDTPATARYGPPDEVAVRAADAGSDLLVYAGGYREGARAARALSRALRSGRLARSRFRASVDRVLRLRAGLPQ